MRPRGAVGELRDSARVGGAFPESFNQSEITDRMPISVELPSLGESVVEGTVSRWLVAEGDTVTVDQPLVEVTTDKVDAEIPSPSAGVILSLQAQEGDVVQVGAVLAQIDTEARGSAPPHEKKPEAVASLVGETAAPSPAPEVVKSDLAEPRATPVARRMAEEARLPLERIEGSGSGGRITKQDVLRHAVEAEPSRPSAVMEEQPKASQGSVKNTPAYARYTLQSGDRVVPMSPVRRVIAEHMVYSKHTSPHVGTVAEIDMSAVDQLRRSHKQAFKETHGFSLTYLPFIAHAVVKALREFPALNASVLEDAIVEKRAIHIGLAAETDRGLVVPVVRNADRFSLTGLAAEIEDLVERARSRRLSADDLSGGTFTISNPGRQGNLYGFAIINQPQVGILRVGEIKKRAVVLSSGGQDSIAIRPMMYAALSYDHRAVDGAPANAFLYRVRELLEAAEIEI